MSERSRVYGTTKQKKRKLNQYKGKFSNLGSEDSAMLKEKRAVVTMVRPNKDKAHEAIAYLWLLDEHALSKFSFSTAQFEFTVNHFFVGLFCLHNTRWVCKKYQKSLGQLIKGAAIHDEAEFQITVHDHLPLNPAESRIAGETSHPFLGRIIDEYELLPADCSPGICIAVRLRRLSSRRQFCWVVSRVLQSKYIHTLTEFHKVWKTPGMRDLIRAQCYQQFKTLYDLLDTSEESVLSKYFGKNEAKINKEVEETDENEEKEEDEYFAWTTAQEEDLVQMIVFPRIPGLKMEQMKKDVMDHDIYKDVEQMSTNKLYRVELNARREICKMWDCPQYLIPNEKGRFEFRFVASGDLLLGRNVSVVDSIGLPKAFGKLMFHLPKFPISITKRILAKAEFRLLEDDDLFVDHDIVIEHNVCFLSVANIEKLEDQNLEPIKPPTTQRTVRPEAKQFKRRLLGMSNETVFSMFQDIYRILSNQKVLELMETNGCNPGQLFELMKKKL